MKNKRTLCFHLFEGDGGDGGGTGNAGLSTGAMEFAKSIGMSEYSQEPSKEPTVEYGLPADGEGESQNGTDTRAEGPTAQEVSTGTDDAKSLEAEFEGLIGKGGKFEQLYGQRVQGAINNRFKNAQDLQGRLEATNDAIGLLYTKYNLEVGDTEGLKNAIETDDDLISSAAEENGTSVENYRELLNLMSDAAKGRALAESVRQEEEKRATLERWDGEANELKATFPNFDLAEEFNNDKFVEAINRVGNVRDAFLISHMDDILSGAMTSSQEQAQQKVINNIQSRAARPAENGATQQAAVQRKTDPSKLTDEDMDKIFEGVTKGKTYSF